MMMREWVGGGRQHESGAPLTCALVCVLQEEAVLGARLTAEAHMQLRTQGKELAAAQQLTLEQVLHSTLLT